MAGGIAGWCIGKSQEETEYVDAGYSEPLFPGDSLQVERHEVVAGGAVPEANPMVEISEESYMGGKWSKRLTATYFREDGVLAGFDDELEPLSPEKLGLSDILEGLSANKAVYAADVHTLIAYEVVLGVGGYAEAKEELARSAVEGLEEKASDLGYSSGERLSEDPFDSVVASVGD